MPNKSGPEPPMWHYYSCQQCFISVSVPVAGLVDTIKPECDFPLHFQGNWMLYEKHRKSTVSISDGRVVFSDRGSFICKAKHWEDDDYKFLSHFTNGWWGILGFD